MSERTRIRVGIVWRFGLGSPVVFVVSEVAITACATWRKV